MSDIKYKYPPGDPQAVTDGCTCPVMDNAYGKGCGYVDEHGNPLYIFDRDCPLHGGNNAEEISRDAMCLDAGDYKDLENGNNEL